MQRVPSRQGRTLTFRIPRDRYGPFHPTIRAVLRQVFRTSDRGYTPERAWEEWRGFCARWGRYYRSIRRRGEDARAMPNEESVILLMGRAAMDKSPYARQVPRIDLDRTLFPDEKPPTSEGGPSEVEE